MQQGNSLRTTVKSTCISRLRSALSTSSCCWSSRRGHIRWASFIGWSQTTMKWCVVRLRRTRPWRPSYHESTVCHRAIMVVHLLPVRPSTTGRTVISRVLCVSSCNHGCPSPPCQAINYWKNRHIKTPLCVIVQSWWSISSLSGHQLLEERTTLSTVLLPSVYLQRTTGMRKLPGDKKVLE